MARKKKGEELKAAVADAVDGENLVVCDNYDKLNEFAADKGMFNLIGLTMRPGVLLWAVRLEHEFYPPRTPKNKLYRFSIVNWENMQFIVVGFPAADKAKAESLAKSCNLRFADGVPTLIEHHGTKHFPMDPDAPNVWSLESTVNWTFDHHGLMELQAKEIDRILADDVDLRSGKINVDL